VLFARASGVVVVEAQRAAREVLVEALGLGERTDEESDGEGVQHAS
jgi:hypothetical protein